MPNLTWKGEQANEPRFTRQRRSSETAGDNTILKLDDDDVDGTAEGCWVDGVPGL